MTTQLLLFVKAALISDLYFQSPLFKRWHRVLLLPFYCVFAFILFFIFFPIAFLFVGLLQHVGVHSADSNCYAAAERKSIQVEF